MPENRLMERLAIDIKSGRLRNEEKDMEVGEE
jgi:hypothetical protein